MPWLLILGDVVYRAACLLGLAIAPPWRDPEPAAPAKLALDVAVSVLLLAAAAYGALRLRASRPDHGGRAASALILLALVVDVACAAIFRGPAAPLGRGLLFVAVPLWTGLALAAGAVAGARARRAASLCVAGVGIVLLGGSARWIVSTEKMWARSVSGGVGQQAMDGLTRERLRAHDYPGALAAIDRCLEANPRSCACLTSRAEVRTQVPGADRAMLDQAIADARVALPRCPHDRSLRATIAIALALRGDGAEAEKEARDALKDDERDARARYALALAIDRQGRPLEALPEAQRAVELGAGHEGAELFAVISAELGGLDGAQRALDRLAGDKTDAPVLFGRALVAERLSDYAKARDNYLSALVSDPTFAQARYNLVLLNLHHGAVNEAKRNAKHFAEAFPGDPRNADLDRRIAAAAPALAPSSTATP